MIVGAQKRSLLSLTRLALRSVKAKSPQSAPIKKTEREEMSALESLEKVLGFNADLIMKAYK